MQALHYFFVLGIDALGFVLLRDEVQGAFWLQHASAFNNGALAGVSVQGRSRLIQVMRAQDIIQVHPLTVSSLLEVVHLWVCAVSFR